MLRFRQYLCINNSGLDISYQGAPYLLSRITPIIKVLSMPMQPTLKTLACHCTYALMEIGINRLSALLNDSLTHIIDGNIPGWPKSQNETYYSPEQTLPYSQHPY